MIKVYALILLTLMTGNAIVAKASGALKVRSADVSDENGDCDQPRETFIEIDNIRVRYVESGAGPVVVMIHGNAGSVDDFAFNTLGTLCRDHRVIAIDRLGHGKSDRPNGTAATLRYQTKLLHETLSRIGVTRPVLVGHSWGGSLALSYAVVYPKDVSAIILLAPAAYPDSGGNQLLRAVLKTPVIGDVSLDVGRIIFGKHILKKELARAFYPDSVPEAYLQHASSLWLKHDQLRAYFEDEFSLNKGLKNISKQYSNIRIPVVIVTGDSDRVVSAKANAFKLKSAISQAKLVELKNTGHEIPQTHPESIYNALTLIPSASAKQRVDQRPAAP